MPEPAEVVQQFIAAWPKGDAALLASFFTDDAVYHNIPMDPIHGRDAIETTLAGFCAGVEQIVFETSHLASAGPVVMTERVDRFTRREGPDIALPVMGVFEVRDGKIAAWRDYFDMNMFTSQLA